MSGLLVFLIPHSSVQDQITIGILEVHQNICQFEISVQHIHLMNGFKSLQYLADKVPCLLLRKTTSYLAKIVEVTSIAVLHKQVEIICCFLDIMQTNDMWALDTREYAYLAFEVLLQLWIQIGLLYDFASHPGLLILLAKHIGLVRSLLS